MTKPARSILLIAGVVITLVIAAVVAVLAFGPSESHFTPGSPEDVIQRYLSSYRDRDFTTAYGFFSAKAQSQLPVDDYVTYARRTYDGSLDSNSRIIVDRVEGSDTRKTVYLTVENVSGSGLELNRWSYDVVIPMVQESSDWKIDELLLGTSPAPATPITK